MDKVLREFEQKFIREKGVRRKEIIYGNNKITVTCDDHSNILKAVLEKQINVDNQGTKYKYAGEIIFIYNNGKPSCKIDTTQPDDKDYGDDYKKITRFTYHDNTKLSTVSVSVNGKEISSKSYNEKGQKKVHLYDNIHDEYTYFDNNVIQMKRYIDGRCVYIKYTDNNIEFIQREIISNGDISTFQYTLIDETDEYKHIVSVITKGNDSLDYIDLVNMMKIRWIVLLDKSQYDDISLDGGAVISVEKAILIDKSNKSKGYIISHDIKNNIITNEFYDNDKLITSMSTNGVAKYIQYDNEYGFAISEKSIDMAHNCNILNTVVRDIRKCQYDVEGDTLIITAYTSNSDKYIRETLCMYNDTKELSYVKYENNIIVERYNTFNN